MNLGSFGTVHTYYKADIICLEAPEKILGSKGQLISEDFFFLSSNTPKPHTANIFDVIFTVLKCVWLSTVLSLHGLLLIAAPSTVE